MALRITGGSAGGRLISAPAGEATRPTADRVREAAYAILGSALGSLAGLEVLDLYAGSGALGLEALSRGAARAVFVESSAACRRVIRLNAERLGFAASCTVLAGSAGKLIAMLERQGERFGLVLADPPYREDPAALVEQLGRTDLLVPSGLFLLEHSRRRSPPALSGALALRTQRRYGDTMLSVYRRPVLDETDAAGRDDGPARGVP